MTDKRGYRKCVRIVIVGHNNNILLGKKIINGTFIGYEFPGGGVEEEESIEEAIVKECLEEVGIKVKNIQSLGLSFKYDVEYPKPERAKLYRGGEDFWYVCEFDHSDKSLYNRDGDVLPFDWFSIDTAIRKIKDSPSSKYNPIRIEALEKVKEVKFKKRVK